MIPHSEIEPCAWYKARKIKGRKSKYEFRNGWQAVYVGGPERNQMLVHVVYLPTLYLVGDFEFHSRISMPDAPHAEAESGEGEPDEWDYEDCRFGLRHREL